MTGDNGQMVRAEAWIFAPGHLSHGNPTRRAQRQPISYLDARAAWAAGTKRRPISRLGRGARGAAAGHVSLGSSTRGAFAAGATGTQRRPIYSFGAVLAADHLLLGVSTHDARAAGAAGTQRRPISCLATQLAAPSRQGRGGRGAAAAHVSLGSSPHRVAAPSRRARPGRSGEVNSQRPRAGGGRGIAAAHLSLRNPTRGAFAAGPGRPGLSAPATPTGPPSGRPAPPSVRPARGRPDPPARPAPPRPAPRPTN
eukprot:tig00020553_g10735.t3